MKFLSIEQEIAVLRYDLWFGWIEKVEYQQRLQVLQQRLKAEESA